MFIVVTSMSVPVIQGTAQHLRQSTPSPIRRRLRNSTEVMESAVRTSLAGSRTSIRVRRRDVILSF